MSSGLEKLKKKIKFISFRGGEVLDTPNLDELNLYLMPPFSNITEVGRFKNRIFCQCKVKNILEQFNQEATFTLVPNGDIESFLKTGGDLEGYSESIKKILLEGLIQNWDNID